jgi:leucyl-tRNA synthetase
MFTPYDPSSAEVKWRRAWADARVFDVDVSKAKDPYYLLVMFPYPSGAQLHVGHWFQYSIPDSYGRFLKMRGKDVFHPMGFDAFGLPAENYAIKTGTPPAASTKENVDNMIEQYKRMGVMFDWSYALNTSDPSYYRWTQWLFLEMYKNGLAYKKEAAVNWCPKDQTVLANEQAQDGKCERCGTEVEKKFLAQWFWKITDYSQRLLDGLEKLDWPEKTKIMQRNWIGRKEGIEITYKIKDSKKTITCFTTRPETNFGATFMVISPEHPDLMSYVTAEQKKAVEKYCEQAKKRTTTEREDATRKKTGAFTGSYAVNDLTGYEMPLYVADYVLMGFGTGVVVGVPGHDLRDYEFAAAMKDIKIVRVIKSADGDTGAIDSADKVFEDEGEIINSEFLNGLHPHAAIPKMMDHMEKKKMGKRVISYRLHDWLVSRQRYWGAPIPIVYDPQGKPHPVPEEHLPWTLPTDVEFKPTGESPLKNSKEFKARTEKIFGKGWTPEYDTMDTFVCSSFYYLRYLAKGDTKKLVEKGIEKNVMPVDMYIGGPEHACMHLIYARFVMMVLKDFGHVSHEEPFQKLVHQGLITHKGAKMSKSRGNVISPDTFVDQYGSDVFRMYLMFMGPFEAGGDWSDSGINGVVRFVQRVWKMLTEKTSAKVLSDKPEITAALHKTIKKVTTDIEALQFNTAISALMQLLNTIEKEESLSESFSKTVAILLAPLAPHLAEELWATLGGKGFAIEQAWPKFDESLMVESTITVVVQVNGKVRGDLNVPKDTPKEEILKQAKELENVKKYLTSAIKKEIYVPGKLVSLVV